MKVNRKKLVDCLRKLFPVLVQNPIVPEYGCFQIQDDKVWVTDGEVMMMSFLPEKLDVVTCVPGISFLHLLESLKMDEISIELDEAQLCVLSGKTIKGTFAVSDVSEMPEIQIEEWNDIPVLDITKFIEGLGFCRFAVSKDKTEESICGVGLQVGKMFACDRYRILRYFLPKSFSNVVCTIPLKYCDILVKNKEEIVTIFCQKDLMFVVELEDGTKIKTSLLPGEFREVEKYFPSNDKFEEIMFGKSFVEILDRHIEFLREVHLLEKEIKVEIEGDTCCLTSDGGELKVLIEKVTMATPLQLQGIGFTVNPILLRDIIKVCPEFKYFEAEGLISFEKGEFSCIMSVNRIEVEKD